MEFRHLDKKELQDLIGDIKEQLKDIRKTIETAENREAELMEGWRLTEKMLKERYPE